MTQLVLNIGTANGGDGDTLRAAMIKVNTNFTEIYDSAQLSSFISITGNEIAATRTNDDLVLSPAGTGGVSFPAIRINDNNIEGTRTNENINLIPAGTGSVIFGAISISGTTLSSADSSIININDGLIVDGTLNVSGASTLSGAVTMSSTLDVASGLTTLSSLSVTGATTLAGPVGIDNLTLNDNIISSASNSDIILSPGGTGSVVIDTLTIDSNINITDNAIQTTATNSDLLLSASGTGDVVVGALRVHGTTITSDDSSVININETLTIDSNINITDNEIQTTASNSDLVLSASGTGDVVAGAIRIHGTTITSDDSSAIQINEALTIDSSISITDNEIQATQSNSDLVLLASGTGGVIAGALRISGTTITSDDSSAIQINEALTIDSSISIADNVISSTQSNSDLVLSASGTGSVKVTGDLDINGGTIDGTVIGGGTAVAGTFTTVSTTASVIIDGVTIADNTVSTNASNSTLELTGNGTGGVSLSGFTFPTTDGSAGQFLSTNGLGVLAFATAGVSLNHSDIADATTTISSSAASVVNTFDKTVYRSAKYFISISNAADTRFEYTEANVTHDGTTAYIVSFGSTTNYTDPLASLSVDVNGDDIRLIASNITSDACVFKFQRIVFDV
jgi:hypothetical protein